MAVGPDRVQLMKQEWLDLGGESDAGLGPIEVQEDAIECAGIYLQDADNRDEDVYVARNGDELILRDKENTTPITLSSLVAGAGGITESSHRILRQLIHFINDGPGEGFTSGAYFEASPTDGPFPASEIWYESDTKAKKIFETLITWSGPFFSVITYKIYDTDGSTVLAQAVDTYTNPSPFDQRKTRVITIY